MWFLARSKNLTECYGDTFGDRSQIDPHVTHEIVEVTFDAHDSLQRLVSPPQVSELTHFLTAIIVLPCCFCITLYRGYLDATK